MMWWTKMIGLVALSVSMLANAGELQRDKVNDRVDAEQEPFESMTIVQDDGPISSLFDNCIAASRSIAAKLFSIKMPGTTDEFIRHVPDSYELSVPAEWKQVTWNSPVSSILECAAAVYEMNEPMFKYNGGDDCKVSKRSYDLRYEPACEAEEHEAVFIQNNVTGICTLPGRILNINIEAGTCTCIHVTTELMSYTEAKRWCKSRKTSIFVQTSTLQYSAIVQLLLGLKVNGQNVSASNFYTAAEASATTGIWYWSLETQQPVNSSSYPSYTYAAEDVLYMKGTTSFKLDFAPKSSFKAGVVCVAEDWPL